MFLVADMLLLVSGVALPSTVAFISGMLGCGIVCTAGTGWSPEAATVRTW